VAVETAALRHNTSRRIEGVEAGCSCQKKGKGKALVVVEKEGEEEEAVVGLRLEVP